MFAKLLGSNTPQYHGQAQTPQRRGGLLGLLTGLFGGTGTPAYAGDGQAVPAGIGSPVFPRAPLYHRPPVVGPPTPAELSAPAEGDSSGAEPEGKTVTIIVRPGPGTTVEEVAQFLRDRVLDA